MGLFAMALNCYMRMQSALCQKSRLLLAKLMEARIV